MTQKPHDTGLPPELRQRARARLARLSSRAWISALAANDTPTLARELHLYRAALEILDEDRREAERLAAARERAQQRYDAAPVGLLTVARNGRITQANRTAARLLGLSQAALTASRFHGLVALPDRSTYFAHRRALLETGVRQRCELRLMRSDGETLAVRLDCDPEIGPEGTRIAFQIAFTEIALHRAPPAGRGTHRLFHTGARQRSSVHSGPARELARALREDELELHYQPVFHASAPGRIVGAEALLRWRHPGRGLLRPGPYIAIAEDTGQIHALGEWVVRTASRDLSAWRGRLDGEASFISVNVSPQQLLNGEHLQRVLALLEDLKATERLTLEITERLALEDGTTRLDTLRATGARLAMDDFGTGFSSLGRLQRLPFDVLKIDRTFVWGVTAGLRSARLVEAIIAMAHALDLKVIAEGVETPEQLAFLQAQGCDYVQGYYLCRPLPRDAFEVLLQSATDGIL